jgi:integrase
MRDFKRVEVTWTDYPHAFQKFNDFFCFVLAVFIGISVILWIYTLIMHALLHRLTWATKHTKRTNTQIVPVHPSLVSMGFLDYVIVLKAKREERLWGNLNWREADGYSNAYGKCYQRYNRHYVTKDPLKCFHSFRHTFADSLKQLGVQESAISELLGHVNDNISTGRYGKKYRPEVLLDVVKKLDYGT